MRTVTATLTLFTLLSVALAAQTAGTYLAAFQPQHSYQIMIKRSHGGNDGFKDVIPQLSVQSILVETGGAAAAGMPVTMTVYRTQRVEVAKSGSAEVDWKFTFTVSPAGEITNVAAQSSDGVLPAEVMQRVLAAHLDLVLFRTAYPIALKNRPTVTVHDAVATPAGPVDLAYDVADAAAQREHGEGERGTVTAIKGTATYNPALTFFTHRAQTDESKMYINENPTDDGKIVVMKVTTTIDAVVSSR